MYPRKLTRAVISNHDYPVVETKAGRLRGLLEEDVFIFRGVQYAEAARYEMPRKVTPWEGTKEAVIYGPVCKEINTQIAHDEYNVPHYHYIQDENCLNLNIWTKHIDTGAKRPVMVWFHGGGYATGSSIELYAYDGMELAEFGDVVVVSVNHRLNCIGYLDLSGYGEKYKYTGNLGQADLVASLQWVQENIAGFGGDPGNVMIFGQSGGGGKVDSLLQTPAADGLYHKASIQSGLFAGGSDRLQKDAQALADLVVKNLGLTRETIEEIEKIPYYKLARAARKAEQEISEMLGRRVSWAPVKDDDYFMGSGLYNPFREETKHIPVLVGSVQGEFDQNYNNVFAEGSKNDWDDAFVDSLIEKIHGDKGQEIAAAYLKAYPMKRKVDCLFTNKSCRTASRDYAFLRAGQGCAPAYNWVFALECPLNNGTIAWHNAEEAYMFHNANYLEASYIPGVSERLQDIMTGAWVAFAETGDPNHVGMRIWTPATRENGACMIFDEETYQAFHHDDELMELLPLRGVMPATNARKGLVKLGGGPRQSL